MMNFCHLLYWQVVAENNRN